MDNNLLSVSPDFFKNLKIPSETPEEQHLEKEKQKMIEWLRKTDLGEEYDGKYVAVYNNEIVTSGCELEKVELEALKKTRRKRSEILIHFIPFKDQVVSYSAKNRLPE